MKENGNFYLLELFNNNEKKILEFIFNNIFFLKKENMEIYHKTNRAVRNGQSNTLYYLLNGKYQLIKETKKRKARLKEYSKNNNLYSKVNEHYESITIDSTGNNAPRKFLKEHLSIDLLHKNYKISHLEDKPNTLDKHGFKNIVIIPSFLDHFIDRKILVDNKNINNIAKLISIKIYNLDEDFFKNFSPKKEEKEFVLSLKKINLL